MLPSRPTGISYVICGILSDQFNMSVCSTRSSSSHIRLMCLNMVGSLVILLYGVGRFQSKGFFLTSSNSYTCGMYVPFWPFSIAII